MIISVVIWMVMRMVVWMVVWMVIRRALEARQWTVQAIERRGLLRVATGVVRRWKGVVVDWLAVAGVMGWKRGAGRESSRLPFLTS